MMAEVARLSEIKETIQQKLDVPDYKNIRPEGSITPQESRDFWSKLFRSEIQEQKITSSVGSEASNSKDKSNEGEKVRNTEKTSFLPRNGGEWEGEPGDSKWKPNLEVIPGDRNGTNPEHKSWAKIMKQYGFESIPFRDGVPDFSEIAKEQVEIDDFTDDRDANFDQADEKASEKRGCTPEEVAKWRAERKYTWHECKDCKTMQKVPTEVHGNVSHSGGVSEYKSQNKQA